LRVPSHTRRGTETPELAESPKELSRLNGLGEPAAKPGALLGDASKSRQLEAEPLRAGKFLTGNFPSLAYKKTEKRRKL
jgi:hypothetical protein